MREGAWRRSVTARCRSSLTQTCLPSTTGRITRRTREFSTTCCDWSLIGQPTSNCRADALTMPTDCFIPWLKRTQVQRAARLTSRSLCPSSTTIPKCSTMATKRRILVYEKRTAPRLTTWSCHLGVVDAVRRSWALCVRRSRVRPVLTSYRSGLTSSSATGSAAPRRLRRAMSFTTFHTSGPLTSIRLKMITSFESCKIQSDTLARRPCNYFASVTLSDTRSSV
mmetsp:Transcript_15403/g.38972  ORF Transcript_15403/g.38972 Transcript_15403/m.38972 type:complete len:224 (-) Transcript_15403:847-1518(-)